jgi:hypothetical protein
MQSETSLKENGSHEMDISQRDTKGLLKEKVQRGQKGLETTIHSIPTKYSTKQRDLHGEGRDLQSKCSRKGFLVKHSVEEGGNVKR